MNLHPRCKTKIKFKITVEEGDGFIVFAILGPLCAFGLVALGALFNLVNDLPLLIRGQRNRTAREIRDQVSPSVP